MSGKLASCGAQLNPGSLQRRLEALLPVEERDQAAARVEAMAEADERDRFGGAEDNPMAQYRMEHRRRQDGGGYDDALQEAERRLVRAVRNEDDVGEFWNDRHPDDPRGMFLMPQQRAAERVAALERFLHLMHLGQRRYQRMREPPPQQQRPQRGAAAQAAQQQMEANFAPLLAAADELAALQAAERGGPRRAEQHDPPGGTGGRLQAVATSLRLMLRIVAADVAAKTAETLAARGRGGAAGLAGVVNDEARALISDVSPHLRL